MPSSVDCVAGEEPNGTKCKNKCRVALVGAQRMRVAKVASMLLSDRSASCVNHSLEGYDISDTSVDINIEYLPCVATFGSYKDENGHSVRYLSKLEYHGPDGTQMNGTTLATFFDDVGDGRGGDGDEDIDAAKEKARGQKSIIDFHGISAVSIGCGIHSDKDIEAIEGFMRALSGGDTSSILVQGIQPSSGFSSMKEENEAYKNLSVLEKEVAGATKRIGPGKMAAFTMSIARRVVMETIDSVVPRKEEVSDANGGDGEEKESDSNGAATATVQLRLRNPSKIQFACRMCRTILFDEDDLENPSHVVAQHGFSSRKRDGHGAGRCESKFLADGLDWMGDMSAAEGKLHCPKCDAKVGLWKWAGAQCSCGSWVTPAIQIPLGKVDELLPLGLQPDPVANATKMMLSLIVQPGRK